jgi:zinc protease
MKKLISPLLCILFCISLIANAQEVTPKIIIEKYINAIGGEAAILDVKDIYMEFEGELQGNAMSLIMHKKLPNKYITIMNISGMGEVNKTIYDGIKGSVTAMGQEQVLEGEAAKELDAQSKIIGELEYLKDLEKLTYAGKEKIDGVECYVLKITNRLGEAVEYYAVESGLKIRQKNEIDSPMGKATLVIDYKDYKKVGNIMFPHSTKQDLGMVAFDLKIKEIKLNQSPEDSLFKVN